MAGGGIFVVNGDLSGNPQLLEMVETAYDSEAVLQDLIERYPSLLAGSQVDPEVPRRWLLVRREQPVPDKLDGFERWSLDHLLVDQDGIPTLVEVKRSTDTRIRREVVGQMLDYAANGAAYWPVATLRAAFEAGTDDPDGRIAQALGDHVSADGLWSSVATNLAGGKLRLVFVADTIPTELRRIVEFLNSQMRSEVIAVEVKQYTSPSNTLLRTLVARVYGRTEEAAAAKSQASPGKQWDEATFFADMEQRDPAGVAIARRVLEWAKANQINVLWGRGALTGSFNLWAGKTASGSNAYLASVRSNGRVEIGFGYLRNSSEFEPQAVRLELASKLAAIPGFGWVKPEHVDKYPTFAIGILADAQSYDAFIATLSWAAKQFVHTESFPPE